MSARSFELKPKKYGNVVVKAEMFGNYTLSKSVLLHGNEIVKIDTKIVLNACNWYTRTTKTAINRALELLDRPERITQLKGQWYINGQKFNGQYTIE